MPKGAGIYVRISDDREGAGLGVRRQEDDCRALAERLGWPVAQVYIDNDVSAYNGRHRPSYGRLLDDVRSGAIDAILAWHPDRLHRRPIELETFIDLCESRQVAVQTARAGALDLSNPSSRMVARMLGTAARYESEQKADRTRRKARELAEQGKVSGGGTRPFGFEADRRTVQPTEAQLIHEAASRVLAGDSLRGICVDWNARGLRTPTGRPWVQNVLRRMMLSGRIAGWREHHGQLVAPAEWPAIIDRDRLERLRRLLSDPARNVRGAHPRRYLLAGFLRCSRCDYRLVARPRTDRVRRYVCASGPGLGGCGKTYILAEPLEELVGETVLVALDSPEMDAAIATRERRTIEAVDLEGLKADEAALKELARDYYVEHVTGRSEYLTARDALEARIEQAKAQLASLHGSIVLSGIAVAARRAWPELSFDRRRAVIAAVIDRILIGPGRRGLNRFDPTRVAIEWRV